MNSIDFSMKLLEIGDQYYDKDKSFTGYAGYMESLLSDLFYDLTEEKKQYYYNRIKDKYHDMLTEKELKELKRIAWHIYRLLI